MKTASIKTLYRLFSFLSDKTNGFKLFVKYKLILGTLLIGISTTACKNKDVRRCYMPALPDDISEPMCYEPAAIDDSLLLPKEDTIIAKEEIKFIPPNIPEQIERASCRERV